MNIIKCPLCGSEAHPVFEKDGYWIKECEGCKHQFITAATTPQHTEHVYDDSYFESGGAGYPGYLGNRGTLIAHGQRYGKLLQKYMQPGTVLDVGAAAGFILKGMTDYGWQGTGVEPNPTMVRYACEQLNLNVVAGTLEDFETDEQYDLVNMIQTVAHFYDLRQAFTTAAERTKPGGYWLIETWDKDSFVAKALGQNWHEYSPPSVLHWFSKNNLSQFVQQFGFEEVAWGRPQKWISGAHAKSLLKYKFTNPLMRKMIDTIPDKMNFPYPNFDLFWALYRKQA